MTPIYSKRVQGVCGVVRTVLILWPVADLTSKLLELLHSTTRGLLFQLVTCHRLPADGLLDDRLRRV